MDAGYYNGAPGEMPYDDPHPPRVRRSPSPKYCTYCHHDGATVDVQIREGWYLAHPVCASEAYVRAANEARQAKDPAMERFYAMRARQVLAA